MTEDEIRNEIAERKNLARNLKIRELLWELYYYGFSQFAKWQTEDPELILPSIKDSLVIENSHFRFNVDGSMYELVYVEGKTETDSYGSGRFEDQIDKTPITISLKFDDKCVFRFDMQKTVEYTPDMPIFKERMGEVTAYIPGPWFGNIVGLRDDIDRHKKAVRGKRNAPRREQQLKKDMSSFGID